MIQFQWTNQQAQLSYDQSAEGFSDLTMLTPVVLSTLQELQLGELFKPWSFIKNAKGQVHLAFDDWRMKHSTLTQSTGHRYCFSVNRDERETLGMHVFSADGQELTDASSYELVFFSFAVLEILQDLLTSEGFELYLEQLALRFDWTVGAKDGVSRPYVQ